MAAAGGRLIVNIASSQTRYVTGAVLEVTGAKAVH